VPLKHFGLREEPFGVAPDPRFLYFGNEHREAISALYTSMLEGRSAALLLAHPGMGKTTLLNYLRARVAATADMVVLSNFADSRRGLLHEVTSLLGCEAEVDNAGENWRRLQRVLIDRARRGRRVVLICDDAQTLSHEALEDLNLLCNCELPQQKLIQIILAGQPGLVPRLRIPRHESLTQRIGVFSHLMPLPPGEVEQYIEHRLRVAGATREVFTPEARLAVARFSDGVPIRINTVCRKALVDSCLAHCNHVEPDIVEEAASDLLNSVYPAQVVEEAVWAQLAPQTRTLPPPAEPLAEWRDEEELTRDDIARRVRSLDKQVVMLKQLGGASNGGAIPGVQSASARPSPPMALSSPATPRWQVSRNFELLLRMERDRDLFGPEPPQPLAAPAGWGTAGDTVRHREPLVPALSALRGLTCAEPERCVLENRILDAAPGGA
jgi:type II secretory pathway predicted ATPase ExeA